MRLSLRPATYAYPHNSSTITISFLLNDENDFLSSLVYYSRNTTTDFSDTIHQPGILPYPQEYLAVGVERRRKNGTQLQLIWAARAQSSVCITSFLAVSWSVGRYVGSAWNRVVIRRRRLCFVLIGRVLQNWLINNRTLIWHCACVNRWIGLSIFTIETVRVNYLLRSWYVSFFKHVMYFDIDI